jgi:predicted DNA-binding transcriptional regulator AlpA
VAIYEFILKFRVGDATTDPSEFLAALGEAGCTDAMVGVGQMGVIGLDYSREASSASEAIRTAIADVVRAIPAAVLVEAAPDLVGLTDVAEFLGFSRQYMRKLAYSRPMTFPAPVHEGKPSMWRLFTVLCWAQSDRGRTVDVALMDVARLTMSLNLAIGERDVDGADVERARAMIA